jgi:cytochrome bd-type quinol oxidase subunit 2
MTLDQLTEVWTPMSVAVALVTGLLVGLVVGRYVADPAYASHVAAPRQYAALIGLMIVAAGVFFYGGQILTSYIGGDDEWTRAVSRLCVWVMYGVMIAVGTWIRIRYHLDGKRRIAHKRALAELSDEPADEPGPLP